MYPRTNYEMSEDDLKTLLEACKPTRVMMIGGTTGSSPQENANRAWAALGKKMGFDYNTVQPIEGKGQCFFSAIPSENETQREERMNRERDEKRAAEIEKLKAEITQRENRLFRCQLDEWMCADPVPLSDEANAALYAECVRRGFTDIVDAYHLYKIEG